jgi:hypothetical protein
MIAAKYKLTIRNYKLKNIASCYLRAKLATLRTRELFHHLLSTSSVLNGSFLAIMQEG